MARTVLFVEVRGFYAAVERAQDPALRTRPVIVGGDPRKRGRVQAATADANATGVELDMPMLEALQRCPQARALRTDMRRYREVSRRLLAVLRRTVGGIERFGLGAAFVELPATRPPAEELAAAMRSAVREELGLPLRIGISSGKFLARLAAEEVGEEGVFRVAAGEEHRFLAPLDVVRLEGVGRKTAATLAELGAHTIGEVAALGRERLQQALGTHGLRIHDYATGRDLEPVRGERHPQSLSRELTLRAEPLDLTGLSERLLGLSQELEAELRRERLAASRVSLKVRYVDQATNTRSQTLSRPAVAAAELYAAASGLLERTQAGARPVRSLGLQLAGLAPAAESDRQLDLFPASD